MAFRTQKISQMTPKGANLEGSDLLEVSTLESGSYVTRSITGQEIIDAAAGSGVTDVTATAPIVSTGGTTPDISIRQSSSVEDGYLSSTDWNTFNDKQDALVSGTNIKTIEGQSILGSGNIDLTKSDVGLGNVDNTSDLNKPISTATQTALNAKQNTINLTTTGTNGAATLVGATLNIPQYSGGGGGNGVHALVKPKSGNSSTTMIAPSTLGTLATIANRMYAMPFIPNITFTTSSFYINVTTGVSGANAKIMVYSNLDGQPDTLLYESTNLDCSTTGIKTASTAFTFNAGTTYWFSFWASAAVGISCVNITNHSLIGFNGLTVITSYIQTVSFGAAPNPFGATSNANGAFPFIGATI